MSRLLARAFEVERPEFTFRPTALSRRRLKFSLPREHGGALPRVLRGSLGRALTVPSPLSGSRSLPLQGLRGRRAAQHEESGHDAPRPPDPAVAMDIDDAFCLPDQLVHRA